MKFLIIYFLSLNLFFEIFLLIKLLLLKNQSIIIKKLNINLI